MDALLKRVIAKVKPGKREIEQEMKLFRGIKGKIESVAGQHTRVLLAGSIARNTHLKGDRDIDIFVLFPQEMPREDFEREGIAIGKKVFRGQKWEKAYTEHPYIRGVLNGFDVEIVPCYDVKDASAMQSAVDRSPLHTEYLKRKLGERQRDEVRLLRQFLKGVGCYGADIRFCSFPGYVAELLVLKYGDFAKTIHAVAKWNRGEVVDVAGHYRGEDKEAIKRFESHLIVVDPTDKNRNVAAALSLTQYARFIAAARAFLRRPSEQFFFPKKERPWPAVKVRAMLQKKELVALGIGYPKGIVADIMWGQLRRFGKKIANQLELNSFIVNRTSEWTDERGVMIVLFELEALVLQRTMKRIGPDVMDEHHSEAFLRAHKELVAGPRIENGKWIIEVERKYSDVRKLLADLIKKEKRGEKAQMKKALNKSARVMQEKDLLALYKKNSEFREYLSEYLRGKEEFSI